jgi:hypothetical protein
MELAMGLNAAIIIMAFVVLAIVGAVAFVQLRMSAGIKHLHANLAQANSRISTLEAQAIGRMAAEEVFSQSPSIGGPETSRQQHRKRKP